MSISILTALLQISKHIEGPAIEACARSFDLVRDEVRKLIAMISMAGFKTSRPELNYDPDQPDRIVTRIGGEILTIETATG